MPAPAGWYPDPGSRMLRWWDGQAWTSWMCPPAQPESGSGRYELRPWRPRDWIGWSAAVLLSIAVSIGAAGVILFVHSTTCNEPATASQRNTGLRDMVIAVLFLALLWAVAVVSNRERWRRVLLGGAIGISPLVLIALSHLGTSTWVGNSFCF